jgi:hypothetical protein
VRLDAVGRVLDIETPTEMKGGGARRGLEEVSGDEAEKIKELARKFVPNVQGTDGVYKARQGGEYFLVDFHEGAEAIVSADGRMFSFRRPIDGSDLPVPVKQTVDQMFTQTTRAYKGEDVLFQFDQKSPAGNAVTIRMRPNGEVVQVINEAAEADEKAVTAGAKESEPAAPAQRSSD